MTVYYVDDSATGANNGTSWTDAWTSLESAVSVAAGSEVRVAYTHNETFSTAKNPDFVNGTAAAPIVIVSCDPVDDSYRAGAIYKYDGSVALVTWEGHTDVWGMSLGGYDFSVEHHATFHDCQLAVTRSGPFDCVNYSMGEFIDCDATVSLGSGAIFSAGFGGRVFVHGGTVSDNGTGTNTLVLTGIGTGSIEVNGVDFTNGSNSNARPLATMSGGAEGQEIIFRNCRMPTYGAPIFSTANKRQRVRLEASQTGTVSAPVLGLIMEYQNFGTNACDFTRYRTGGASDGETSYSLAMVPGVTNPTYHSPLVGPPITRWVAAGSQTITLYFASGVTHTDKTLWCEFQSPSEDVTADSQNRQQITTLKPSSADSAANHTADAVSIWNGTGVTTLQKMSWSINPTEPGLIKIVPYLAGANAVYIDPKVAVT